MSKINAFRKILREEIALALRQELPKILEESKKVPEYKQSIKKQMDQSIPGTLNEVARKRVTPVLTKNSTLNSLLADTAESMTHRDTSLLENTQMDGYSAINNYSQEVSSVGNVNDMLAASRPSSTHEMIQINAVPDFNGLMDKMLNKGVI
jgi:hypothetical protein